MKHVISFDPYNSDKRGQKGGTLLNNVACKLERLWKSLCIPERNENEIRIQVSWPRSLLLYISQVF